MNGDDSKGLRMIDTMPMIRLSVEGTRHAVVRHFQEYEKEIVAGIQYAAEKFLEADNFNAILTEIVDREIQSEMRRQVEAYFHHGEGHAAIKKVVMDRFAIKRKGYLTEDEDGVHYNTDASTGTECEEKEI